MACHKTYFRDQSSSHTEIGHEKHIPFITFFFAIFSNKMNQKIKVFCPIKQFGSPIYNGKGL